MDWQAGVPPTNGDGLEFRSPDGEATLIVSGALHVDATIGEAMDRFAKPDEGEVVTSTERDERSVTVAGDAGDHAFYRRSILSCHDQVWDTISIEYPASKEAQYAPLIAHIAASLRSGPSAEVPDCP
ncbi:MAG TPA: hypothetical protein VFB16_06805 [Bauldia sp.]|nr:hypothetical protein [Bauldia sp.]